MPSDPVTERRRAGRRDRNPYFPVNTLTLMRSAVAARSLGVFARYVDEMFRHMWADPKQMDDPAVLAAALAESGFDDEKILALAPRRAR